MSLSTVLNIRNEAITCFRYSLYTQLYAIKCDIIQLDSVNLGAKYPQQKKKNLGPSITNSNHIKCIGMVFCKHLLCSKRCVKRLIVSGLRVAVYGVSHMLARPVAHDIFVKFNQIH